MLLTSISTRSYRPSGIHEPYLYKLYLSHLELQNIIHAAMYINKGVDILHAPVFLTFFSGDEYESLDDNLTSPDQVVLFFFNLCLFVQ